MVLTPMKKIENKSKKSRLLKQLKEDLQLLDKEQLDVNNIDEYAKSLMFKIAIMNKQDLDFNEEAIFKKYVFSILDLKERFNRLQGTNYE